MSAETELDTIERIIKENPYFYYKGWRRDILNRAGLVRKEITALRNFALLKPGNVQDIVLSKAQFLEDRLTELLEKL